jgi:hypothetical protein
VADRPDRPDRPDGRPAGPAARPAVRRLWQIGGSLAAVGVLGMGTMTYVSQLAHEEETVVRHFDGSGLRLVDVHDTAGRVEIVGTRGDDVRVQAHVGHGLRSTGHSERIEGDRLVLRATCPIIGSNFCGVTYVVEVPEDVDVRVRSDQRITVTDIHGDVDVNTDDGSVEVARIEGDVELSSDNGRVTATDLRSATAHAESDNGRVELGFLDPPTDVTATSDNGSVEVVLPDTQDDYVLDVSSDNGTAASPDIRTDPESPRTVTASSDNGDVTVRYARGSG